MKIPDHFSLKSEEKDHYLIHDERDGKEFPVAKSMIGFSMLGALSKIKKFADGGKVPDALAPDKTEEFDILANLDMPQVDSIDPQLEVDRQPQSTAFSRDMDSLRQGLSGMSQFGGSGVPVQTAPVLQQPIEAERVPTQDGQALVSQPQAAPPQTGMTSGDYGKFMGAMGQQVAGVQGMANAQAQQFQEQEKQQAEFNKNLQNIIMKSDEKMLALDAENAQLTKDVADYKVDPRRYISNMSTGNKAMAVISLLLGGIGSGLAGGPNMGAEQLDKMIQNDIDAQKAELGKKENLLSRNLQKYGNLNAATQATMMQQNALLQGQLAQTAAKFGTPMAMEKAKFEIGRLKQEQMKLSLEFKQSLLQSSLRDQMLKEGGAGQMDENKMARYINAMIQNPAEKKEAREELSMVQGYKTTVNGTRKLFERAKKIGAIEGSLPLSTKKAEIEAISAEIYALVRSGMRGQGALSDQEMESTVKPLIPSATDTKPQIQKKLISLERMLANKVQGGTPVLSGYGFPVKLDVPKIDPAQLQKAQDWLKANPKDPKAPMVQKKLQEMMNG